MAAESGDTTTCPHFPLALRWLCWRFGVALGWPWGGFWVAWGWLWGAYRLAIKWLWCGFGVALGWLCTPESMPSICLLYGFGVALGGFVRPAFCLRLPHFPRWPKPGKAAFCRFTVCLACITRPGGDWGHPRECQSHPRRVSGGSPVSLPGCHNRFAIGN